MIERFTELDIETCEKIFSAKSARILRAILAKNGLGRVRCKSTS